MDEEVPPEIVAAVQQAVVACDRDRADPTCQKARALCGRIKNTSVARLDGIQQICDAARTPKWVWWTLAGLTAASITVAVVYVRRRRLTA